MLPAEYKDSKSFIDISFVNAKFFGNYDFEHDSSPRPTQKPGI